MPYNTVDDILEELDQAPATEKSRWTGQSSEIIPLIIGERFYSHNKDALIEAFTRNQDPLEWTDFVKIANHTRGPGLAYQLIQTEEIKERFSRGQFPNLDAINNPTVRTEIYTYMKPPVPSSSRPR